MHYLPFLILALSAFPAADPTDPLPAFEAALDGFMAEVLEERHVPGCSFVLVRDGAIALSKGYGLASLEPPVPVVPDKTLFRIGSISKLLTATAVMQLVEQGRLDLKADVNSYINAFQIPDAYQTPITVRHLLTHTAGFDDQFLHIAVPAPEQLEPLGAYLARRLPPRVQQPGYMSNYSNFGYTLAAYLVEAVADRPFEQYVDTHVALPLGMAPGGFYQPLPDPAHLAESYRWYPRDGYVRAPGLAGASQVWPSGAYAATAVDMAKFMIAHLNLGRSPHDPQNRILQESTVQEMHRTQFPDGVLKSRALGFSVWRRDGQRILWHTGRIERYTAMLVIVPQLNLGFFAACNADNGDQLRNPLYALVKDHFFPPHTPAAVSVCEDAVLWPVTGAYRPVRHVRQGLEKIAMFGQEQILSEGSTGLLLTRKPFQAREAAVRWQLLAPSDLSSPAPPVFQAMNTDPTLRMSFPLAEVKPPYLYMDQNEFVSGGTFVRLAWYETTCFAAAAAGFAVLIFLSMLLRWFSAVFVRRFRPMEDSGPSEMRTAQFHLGIMSLLHLIFVVSFGATFLLMDKNQIVFGFPPLLAAVLHLPFVGGVWTVIAGFKLRRAWDRCENSRLSCYHLLTVLLSSGLFLWLLNYWNLIGLRE
jgi:CubicO group peptidase (beta-lactamase class C family)